MYVMQFRNRCSFQFVYVMVSKIVGVEQVARRVAEMQAVVASSEEYLSRQQHHSQQQQQQQPCPLGISSDSSDISHFSLDNDAPPPAPLKHSDSLLLLTQVLEVIKFYFIYFIINFSGNLN